MTADPCFFPSGRLSFHPLCRDGPSPGLTFISSAPMMSLLAAPQVPLVFAVTVIAVTPLVAVMMTFAGMVVAVVSPMLVVAWVVMSAVTSPSQIRTSRVRPRIIIRIGLMVPKPESRQTLRAIGY